MMYSPVRVPLLSLQVIFAVVFVHGKDSLDNSRSRAMQCRYFRHENVPVSREYSPNNETAVSGDVETCSRGQRHCYAIILHGETRILGRNDTTMFIGNHTFLQQGCWHGDTEMCEHDTCTATFHNTRGNMYLNNTRLCCCSQPMCNVDYVFKPDEFRTNPNAPPSTTNPPRNTLTLTLIILLAAALLLLVFYLLKKLNIRKLCLRNCSRRNVGELATAVELTELQTLNEVIGVGETDSGVSTMGDQSDLAEKDYLHIGSFGTLLHTGAISSVHRGRDSDGNAIIIKTTQHYQAASFAREREMLAMLNSCCESSVIVKCLGCVVNDPQERHVYLLFEDVPLGDMQTALRNFASPLSWNQTCSFTYQLLEAVKFLHSTHDRKRAIAHRDLSSKNVLIRSFNPPSLCVCDFNSSCFLELKRGCPNDEINLLPCAGTHRYMAPEIIENSVNLSDTVNALKQADMYSTGLLIWELLACCETQHHDQHHHQQTGEVASTSLYKQAYDAELEQLRVSQPDMFRTSDMYTAMYELVCSLRVRPVLVRDAHGALRTLCRVVEECWDDDADARISAATALARLMKTMNGDTCDEPDSAMQALGC